MKRIAWLLLMSGVVSIVLAMLQFPFGIGIWGATVMRVERNYQALVERGIAQKHFDAVPTLLSGFEIAQFRLSTQTAACFLVISLVQTGAAIVMLRSTRSNVKAEQVKPQHKD